MSDDVINVNVVDGIEEAPADGVIYGRKDLAWVNMTAPANLQVRRGTAAEVAAITPLEGEPVWATDTKKLYVGDGSTAGGILAGNRSFAAASAGEANRSQSETRTVDPNIAVTLGPAGTYYVNIYATFQAEDEENYGTASLNIALPSTNLTYIAGASSTPATQSVTAEVYEYTRTFVCTSSQAGVTLGIYWRAANSSPILRGQSYLVATLVT